MFRIYLDRPAPSDFAFIENKKRRQALILKLYDLIESGKAKAYPAAPRFDFWNVWLEDKRVRLTLQEWVEEQAK